MYRLIVSGVTTRSSIPTTIRTVNWSMRRTRFKEHSILGRLNRRCFQHGNGSIHYAIDSMPFMPEGRSCICQGPSPVHPRARAVCRLSRQGARGMLAETDDLRAQVFYRAQGRFAGGDRLLLPLIGTDRPGEAKSIPRTARGASRPVPAPGPSMTIPLSGPTGH